MSRRRSLHAVRTLILSSVHRLSLPQPLLPMPSNYAGYCSPQTEALDMFVPVDDGAETSDEGRRNNILQRAIIRYIGHVSRYSRRVRPPHTLAIYILGRERGETTRNEETIGSWIQL